MELLQLKYFYKIAHARTMTEAADELCISQSSLSRMLGRLEEEFQMEFFDRRGRKLELNENGRVFLHYCTQVLNALDEMQTELGEIRGRRDASVSVGFYAISNLLPDIMRGFRERYPQIPLRIMQNFEENRTSSSLDLIINSSAAGEEPEDAIVLLEEDILLAVPKQADGSVFSGEGAVDLSELAELDIASLVRNKPVRDITEKYLKQAGVKFRIGFETDSPVTLRRLMSEGAATAFLPEKTWKLSDMSKVDCLRLSPPCRRSIYVRWSRPYYKNAAAVLFFDFLRDFFRDW